MTKLFVAVIIAMLLAIPMSARAQMPELRQDYFLPLIRTHVQLGEGPVIP